MTLSETINNYLISQGAVVVGFADLSDVDLSKLNDNYLNFNVKSGIVFGTPMPTKLIESIRNGPNQEYYKYYNDTNENSDNIAESCEKFLKNKGYNAYAQITKRNPISEQIRTVLPHKKIATKAGLGWIGKSALLVNLNYGNSLSLGSILTDEILNYGKPTTSSMCGTCTKCVDICPANALSDKLWNINIDRNEFYNVGLCVKKATEMTIQNIGINKYLCGRCITVCPHTLKYIEKTNKT